MSNIFAPYVRYSNQRLPIAIGTGPIVEGYYNMLLGFTAKDALQCARDVAIHHHSAALPFDTNGRLVVSTGAIAYRDQGVPFTATGAVATQDGTVVYADQGLSFTASGHVATHTGSIVIPGEEWFQYFKESPTDFELPIEDFSLTPQMTCMSLQLVVTGKVDWADIPNARRFLQYTDDDTPLDRFRVATDAADGGFACILNINQSGQVNRLRFPTMPDAGVVVDFRWTFKPVGDPTGQGLRGWLDQSPVETYTTPNTFSSPLTQVFWDDTYHNLVALRINHVCSTTDAEIIAWPTYE